MNWSKPIQQQTNTKMTTALLSVEQYAELFAIQAPKIPTLLIGHQHDNMVTEQLCIDMVTHYGRNLSFVPCHLITETMCRIAVEQTGCALEFVSPKFKTAELCQLAVHKDGRAIKYVPVSLQTEELCFDAVNADVSAIQYLSANQITEQICIIVLKLSNSHKYYFTKFIPQHMYTDEVWHKLNDPTIIPGSYCTDAVWIKYLQATKNIDGIPPERRTESVCSAMVSINAHFISSVPEAVRTPLICHQAIATAINQRNVFVCLLQYIPDRFKTEQACLDCVTLRGNDLQFVPDYLKTESVCRAAIYNNLGASKFLPNHFTVIPGDP